MLDARNQPFIRGFNYSRNSAPTAGVVVAFGGKTVMFCTQM